MLLDANTYPSSTAPNVLKTVTLKSQNLKRRHMPDFKFFILSYRFFVNTRHTYVSLDKLIIS